MTVSYPKIRPTAAAAPRASICQQQQRQHRVQWRSFFSTLLHQMDESKEKKEEAEEGGGSTGSWWAHKVRLVLPHALLYVAIILYGLFGALVFQRLERPFEVDHLQKYSLAVAQAQQEFVELKWAQLANGVDAVPEADIEAAVDQLIRTHMEAFDEGISAQELAMAIEALRRMNDTMEDDQLWRTSLMDRMPKWHFHSSLFFTVTLLTLIGYGNLVPISPFGRIFCICYAALGIPMTLITIADVAKFFGDLIMSVGDWLERRVFRRKRGDDSSESSLPTNKQQSADVDLLQQAGPYTRAFVLFLLFSYMLTMAVLFSRLQPDWGLLESLYFTLITLVTIGFGDFCPPMEGPSGGTAFGWILFIIGGLILSTLTVDMVGSSYIDRIHTLGRDFHLGSLLTMLKLGRGEAGIDSARLLRQLHDGAFIPADLKLIPYIDQLFSQRSSAETLLEQHLGLGTANGQHRSLVSYAPDPTSATALKHFGVAIGTEGAKWKRKFSRKCSGNHYSNS